MAVRRPAVKGDPPNLAGRSLHGRPALSWGNAMSWDEIKPKRGRPGEAHGVRVSAMGPFTITIGADVATELGWRVDERARLMMGRGEHFGTMRVVWEPSEFGTNAYLIMAGAKGASTLKIRIKKLPGSSDGKHQIERVPFTVGDGFLEIKLPGWAIGARAEQPRAALAPAMPPTTVLASAAPSDPATPFIKPLTREQMMWGRA